MSLISRSLVVACIGLGFAFTGQVAEAGIMEGIVNQVLAQFEHDVKSTFTRKPARPDLKRPQAAGTTTVRPPVSRQPVRRGLFR